MWGETIWAISARAELGLGIAGFSSDSSPISLVQCAVAAKKTCKIKQMPLKMRELFCLYTKSWDIPILGGGMPLVEGMDSRHSAVPCRSGQLECCFHVENWENNGLTLALRERAAKLEMVAELTAFTGALPSRHGLSLAVKPRRWKKLVK